MRFPDEEGWTQDFQSWVPSEASIAERSERPYHKACLSNTRSSSPTSPSRQFEKETTMGTRAEQLASKFDQACREINMVVEKLLSLIHI